MKLKDGPSEAQEVRYLDILDAIEEMDVVIKEVIRPTKRLCTKQVKPFADEAISYLKDVQADLKEQKKAFEKAFGKGYQQ